MSRELRGPTRVQEWWRLAAAFAAGLAVLSVGLLAGCDDNGEADGSSSIEVSNARAQFTTTDVGAVYLDIRSTGAGDVLLSASSKIADDTQIHEIVTEGASAMMRPVEGGIPIDPGGHVSLQPGGYHVMLLGVEEIPEPGATFEVVLEFEDAGRMIVTVHVQEFGDEDAGMGHGSMDEGEMDEEGTQHE